MLIPSTLEQTKLGRSISGRFDLDHYMSFMKHYGAESQRTYLVDHEFVNAVFRRHSTGVQYVCRSVVRQRHLCGFVLVGVLIQKSGSSFAPTMLSENRSAIHEMAHEESFWEQHSLVYRTRYKKCVYCGAEPVDEIKFGCGTPRDYSTGSPNQDHPHTVHESIISF